MCGMVGKVALVLVVLISFGCGEGKPGMAVISVKGHRLTVELARTSAEHQRGLQERDELPSDAGMLFIFGEKGENAVFWMDKTRIPLSVAYVGQDGVIFQIEKMQPMTTELHRSRKPARYALEVNQGWFADHDVKVGDVVDISGL